MKVVKCGSLLRRLLVAFLGVVEVLVSGLSNCAKFQ
jgi:hypothetical protein